MGSLNVLVCALLVGQAVGLYLAPLSNIRPTYKVATLSSSAMKYVITGQKDNNGHWTEEVKMEHNGEEWHAEFAHSTLQEENGKPKLQIIATFTANGEKKNEKEANQEAETKPDVETDVVFQIFPSSQRDWFGANADCEEWGGNLAVPNTKAKVEEMTKILNEYKRYTQDGNPVFVGINDIEEEGNFVTVFGKPVFNSDKSVWSPVWFNAQQPDDDKGWTKDGEDCGSLRHNGGLNDVPCKYDLPFICEKPRSQAAPASPEQTQQEDDAALNIAYDASIFDDSDGDAIDNESESDNGNKEDDTLVFFPRSTRDWQGAGEACNSWGGHLAIPDSEEKVVKMAKMLISQENNPEGLCAFVGFNDIEKEGNFVTIFGKPVFDSKASWTPQWFKDNQPDDDKDWSQEGEDCGSIHPNGGLNDVPCRYNLPYFCEKSEKSAPTAAQPDVEPEKELDPYLVITPDTGVNNVVYVLLPTATNWFGAKDVCKKEGGHLLTANSVEQAMALQDILTLSQTTEAMFLGSGKWAKQDLAVNSSDPHAPYKQLDDDEDEDEPDRDCPLVDSEGVHYSCMRVSRFVYCEIDIKPSEDGSTPTSLNHLLTDDEDEEVNVDKTKVTDSSENHVETDSEWLHVMMADEVRASAEDGVTTSSIHSSTVTLVAAAAADDDDDVNHADTKETDYNEYDILID